MKALSKILSILFFTVISLTLKGQTQSDAPTVSAAGVIELIINKTGAATISNTVDVIKEGDPETQVKGIITCMFATMDVLKQAVEKNCNLIIVHEPLYYNHTDATTQFQNDPVFLEKKRFINDNKLVIWRFHDYIHSMKPDGIETGMVAKLGWKNYAVSGKTNQFVLPETDLKGLLKSLKMVFPENAYYVIGDPDMKLSSVKLAVGAPGSIRHIRLLEEENTEVVIAGESPQWETYEYSRDAVDQGRKKAIVFIGHIASEEAGMDFCAGWLKSFIKVLPVYFVRSGSSYWSY